MRTGQRNGVRRTPLLQEQGELVRIQSSQQVVTRSDLPGAALLFLSSGPIPHRNTSLIDNLNVQGVVSLPFRGGVLSPFFFLDVAPLPWFAWACDRSSKNGCVLDRLETVSNESGSERIPGILRTLLKSEVHHTHHHLIPPLLKLDFVGHQLTSNTLRIC